MMLSSVSLVSCLVAVACTECSAVFQSHWKNYLVWVIEQHERSTWAAVVVATPLPPPASIQQMLDSDKFFFPSNARVVAFEGHKVLGNVVFPKISLFYFFSYSRRIVRQMGDKVIQAHCHCRFALVCDPSPHCSEHLQVVHKTDLSSTRDTYT